MVRAATVICCLLLAGCEDGKKRWSQNDIRAIANDGRTETLESKVAALEAKVIDQDRQILELRAEDLRNSGVVLKLMENRADDLKRNNGEFDRLSKNDEVFRVNVNWLLARQGVKEIPSGK